VLNGEEFVRRSGDEPGVRDCYVGGGRVAWPFSPGGGPAKGDLDREQGRENGAEGAGDDPASMRVQPAAPWMPPCCGLVWGVNRPRVVCVASRAVVGGGCRVLLGLERAHDLLGGRSVASGQPESVAAVALLAGVELGERRAVGGHGVVGETERQRAEVLFRLAGCGRVGRGLSRLALFAAFAGVLEVPRAVGALLDRSVCSSAVVF